MSSQSACKSCETDAKGWLRTDSVDSPLSLSNGFEAGRQVVNSLEAKKTDRGGGGTASALNDTQTARKKERKLWRCNRQTNKQAHACRPSSCHSKNASCRYFLPILLLNTFLCFVWCTPRPMPSSSPPHHHPNQNNSINQSIQPKTILLLVLLLLVVVPPLPLGRRLLLRRQALAGPRDAVGLADRRLGGPGLNIYIWG